MFSGFKGKDVFSGFKGNFKVKMFSGFKGKDVARAG